MMVFNILGINKVCRFFGRFFFVKMLWVIFMSVGLLLVIVFRLILEKVLVSIFIDVVFGLLIIV